VGATRSDNIGRARTDKQSDTMATVGTAIDFLHDGRVFDLDARGNFDYVEYLDNSFEGRLLGNLNALAELDFIPQRFMWRTQDTFGQLDTDPFAPETPDTVENVNYLTTGPVVQFALGTAARLQLTGTYSLTHYEDSPLDSDRVGGTVAVIRDLSDASSISINATSESINFEDQIDADYDRSSAYLHYDLIGSRSSIKIDAGYTEVKGSVTEKQSGTLGRITFDHQMSPNAAVSIYAMNQISDSADVFRETTGSRSLVRETNVISTPNAVEEKGVGAGWAYARARTSLALAVSRTKEEYQASTDINRKITSLQVNFQRRLGPVTTLSVEARHDDEEFVVSGLEDKELTIVTRLRWAVGRRAGITLSYDWFDRNSNNTLTEYSENRFGVAFSWRAIGANQ
jgi:hypothetical protein